ncbi:MAG: hypothetical protein ACFCU7_19300 [Pleurocapsa sp.]
MLDRSDEPINLTQMDVGSLWYPMVQHTKYAHNTPKRMERAQGCYVTDAEGKEYLARYGS